MLLESPCVVPACAFLKFELPLLKGGWEAAVGGYCCLSSVSILIFHFNTDLSTKEWKPLSTPTSSQMGFSLLGGVRILVGT